jgi:hypothetical protein
MSKIAGHHEQYKNRVHQTIYKLYHACPVRIYSRFPIDPNIRSNILPVQCRMCFGRLWEEKQSTVYISNGQSVARTNRATHRPHRLHTSCCPRYNLTKKSLIKKYKSSKFRIRTVNNCCSNKYLVKSLEIVTSK